MQRSFLRNALVYALGDLFLLMGGIVLLPLYTRCLSGSEVGSLELLERVSEVLAIALILRGLPLGVIVLFRQARSEQERGRVVGAGVLLALAATGVGLACLALLAGALTAELRLESEGLLAIAVLASLVDGVGVVILAANQARLEAGYYVWVSLGQFIIRVLLCILLVVVLGWGIWGVVTASLARSLAFAAVLISRETRRGMCWPDVGTLRELLAFALPFLPSGLCFFVLHSADRFILKHYVDQAEIGIYGLGYRLAMLVGMFSLTPLFRVWSAQMHDVAQTSRAPRLFARVATYLLAAYCLVGLGLCLLDQELITLVAGPAYAGAGPIVAPVVLAYGFLGASTLFDAAFYVRRQTRSKAWIALASALVMLALYAALIPAHGSLGAALATVGGFVFHALLTWRIAQRVFPIPYEYGRLLAMLLSAAAICLVGQQLEPGLAMLPVKLALWLLWPVMLWHGGLIRRSERRRVRQLLRSWLNWRLGDRVPAGLPMVRLGRSGGRTDA